MIGTPARPSSNDPPPWLALGMFAVCWLMLPGGMPGALRPTTLPWARFLLGPDMGGGVGGLLGTLRHPVNSYERPVSPTASNPVTERVNLSNGRGDIVAQSDVAGTLTWTASYEAYGKRTLELGSNEDRQRANTKEEDPSFMHRSSVRHAAERSFHPLAPSPWLPAPCPVPGNFPAGAALSGGRGSP